MFSDVTVSPGVGSGLNRDVKLSLQELAKRRMQNKPTDDVHAAFKEGERAPVAGAMPG